MFKNPFRFLFNLDKILEKFIQKILRRKKKLC